MSARHPYSEKEALLTSKHKKLSLIAPHFQERCGLVIREAALDTDRFGTFAGEVERVGTPLETAIKKAHFGLETSNFSIGLASEGSIAPDYLIPFVQSDIEIMVLVDTENDIIISEVHRSFDITAVSKTVDQNEDLTEFLHSADFPNHHLIVQPNESEDGPIFKGVETFSQLKEAITLAAEASADNQVRIQSDLRAHHSPSRQKIISEVARLLALRVGSLCPDCSMPGWGLKDYFRGLNCSACSLSLPAAIHREIFGCVKCAHTRLGSVVATEVDPASCPHCNP
jgi:hypothetical protein